MQIYPAVHYTMGGLWVDYELQTSIRGLYALGEANFSDHVALEGYQLKQNGLSLDVTLYWRTYQQLQENYGAFIHVFHGDALLAQQDGILNPPMQSWIPGQLISTTQSVELPANASEPESIYIGLYTYPSLERLPVVLNNVVQQECNNTGAGRYLRTKMTPIALASTQELSTCDAQVCRPGRGINTCLILANLG